MEDVTDSIFREVVNTSARPDVFFTEFVNVEGLFSRGRDVLIKKLEFNKSQLPLVAQIWGLKPDNFKKAAELIKKLGFSGVDINMGCPDRDVIKTGAGGALIDNNNLAKEIIIATKEGAGDVPVSVKTRIGFDKIVTNEWVTFLLKQNIAALSVHLRTVREVSKVPAHWDEINTILTVRKEISPSTTIIGNGDVFSYAQAVEKYNQYKVEGIMIGRGIFFNPWVFSKKDKPRTNEERLNLLKMHLDLYEKTSENRSNYSRLKKYFKMYVRDFDEASELRAKLMCTEDVSAAQRVVLKYLNESFN